LRIRIDTHNNRSGPWRRKKQEIHADKNRTKKFGGFTGATWPYPTTLLPPHILAKPTAIHLKGLSYEIDLENVDEN
jgi:hypothetical protein